jgi:hypothetical protein
MAQSVGVFAEIPWNVIALGKQASLFEQKR